jgi:hypothetical protein
MGLRGLFRGVEGWIGGSGSCMGQGEGGDGVERKGNTEGPP